MPNNKITPDPDPDADRLRKRSSSTGAAMGVPPLNVDGLVPPQDASLAAALNKVDIDGDGTPTQTCASACTRTRTRTRPSFGLPLSLFPPSKPRSPPCAAR